MKYLKDLQDIFGIADDILLHAVMEVPCKYAEENIINLTKANTISGA